MITVNNVQYRNLEEQVEKNKSDIEYLATNATALNEFGIKVVGQFDTFEDIQISYTNPLEYGDAFAIGTAEPYTIYVWTRANVTHPNDYFINLGHFPAPGPQGIQGIRGPQGVQGIQGTIWTTNGSTAPKNAREKDIWLQQSTGSVYQLINGTWTFTNNIRGPQGPQGMQGPIGPVGPQGPIGPKGETGPQGKAFTIVGVIDNDSQLPDPTTLQPGDAYLVGTDIPYELYVQVHSEEETAWLNVGSFGGIQGETGPQGPQGETGAAGPQGPRGKSIAYMYILRAASYAPTQIITGLSTTNVYTTNSPKVSVGDNIILFWHNTATSKTYIYNTHVTSFASDTEFSVQVDDSVETSGMGPLMGKVVFSLTSSANKTISTNISNFNRTPLSGEFVNIVFTDNGNNYMGVAEVTALSGNSVTLTVRQYVQISLTLSNLPYATESTKGVVKAWKSGNVLYIKTTG